MKGLMGRVLGREYYVVADPRDNSVTLSRDFVRRLKLGSAGAAKVMVVRVSDTGEYAFVLNPDVGDGTALADLQYNAKENCIGFESLVPTVNRILYDYGLGAGAAVRLDVSICRSAGGMCYYKMLRPDAGKFA